MALNGLSDFELVLIDLRANRAKRLKQNHTEMTDFDVVLNGFGMIWGWF